MSLTNPRRVLTLSIILISVNLIDNCHDTQLLDWYNTIDVIFRVTLINSFYFKRETLSRWEAA